MYPSENQEENVVVELDGKASLGVCLKSRFGGKGCYVDEISDQQSDQGNRSAFMIHVGDLLWSINDERVHHCSIQQIYTKVKSLSFPMILHFRKTSVSRDVLSVSDFVSIHALRLHPWISHFLMNGAPHHHQVVFQALWSRVFQSAVWLHILDEIDEEWKGNLTCDHMKRTGDSILLSFPSHLTDPREMLAHVRHMLRTYLSSSSVQTSVTAIISAFAASSDYARMVAFYPDRSGWQYVPLSMMVATSEGMLCLAAILAGSSSSSPAVWKMIVIAHGYVTAAATAAAAGAEGILSDMGGEKHRFQLIVWEVMPSLAAVCHDQSNLIYSDRFYGVDNATTLGERFVSRDLYP